jgi:hypothetical protein
MPSVARKACIRRRPIHAGEKEKALSSPPLVPAPCQPISLLITRCISSPSGFGVAVPLTYAILILPILAWAHFDLSVFIVAGDRFANAAALAVPIRVQANSTGFDGQFYYRMALAPFDLAKTAFGITIDDPPLRMQRILYPILAWFLSFGQKPFAAAAMVGVNLLGLAAIAASSVRLTSRLVLPVLTPLAIVFWPGFLITLTHDTTEILSVACILLTLEAYFTGNLTTLFLAGSAATLSRETGVLVLGGLLCVSLWDGLRSKVHPRQLVTLAVGASALLPFFLWQATLSHVYRQSAMSSDVAANLGWPFEGVISTVWEALAGTRFYVHSSALQLAMRGFVVVSAPFLLYLCSLVAWRLYAVLRDASFRAVGAGWMPLAMLMMLLTGGAGPWGDPVSYLRAFSECFVIGALIVGWLPMSSWLTKGCAAGGLLTFGVVWGICFMALRK